MNYLGDYDEDSTVYYSFSTNDSSGAAVAPSSAFEAADVKIYKDGSATQKTSTNGITMTSPFDSITGLHVLSIDTSNDTGDAGFWVAGADYLVVLDPDETVDSQTVVHPLFQFSIENRSPLRPTTAQRTLDVAATGEAGVDFGNVTGTLSQANVGWVDANSRVDVGSWLGTAVTLGNGAPDVNIASTDDIDLSATQKASVNAQCDTALTDYDAVVPADLLPTNDLIESQRDDHAQVGKGSIFYVDPVNGDTHANGNRGGRSDPYASIQDCHDNAVTDYNHDVIMLVAGKTDGQTVLDEQPTISKNYVFVRGPGQGFLLKSTSNGDVLTLSGEGVEASSFEVQTNTAGSGNAVVVTGDFSQVRHVVVSFSQGDGIQVTGCSKGLIENCRLFSVGQTGTGDGIAIDGTAASTQFVEVKDCEIYDAQGDGIALSGSNVDNAVLLRNTIHGSTGWGINIGSNVTATFVANNFLGNNTSGDIQDNGTNSDVERNDDWAADSSLPTNFSSMSIDASGHVTTGTLESDSMTIDGVNLDAAIQIIAAVCAGRVSGAGTGTEVFKGLDEATTRVTVTVDSSGNRTDIVYVT